MFFRSSTRDVGALNLGYPDNWERLEVNGVSRWQMARSAELIRSATLANRGRKSCLRSVPSVAAALITGEWGIRSPVNNKVALLGGTVVVVVVEVVVVEGAAVVVVSSVVCAVVVVASRTASVEVVVTDLTLLPHALIKK